MMPSTGEAWVTVLAEAAPDELLFEGQCGGGGSLATVRTEADVLHVC